MDVWVPEDHKCNLKTCQIERNDLVHIEKEYNNKVLCNNWYEDRLCFRTLCPCCTGDSVYKTEFVPHRLENYNCIPPKVYRSSVKFEGEGWPLLRDVDDYRDYLKNYMTTYDLMHNWEVRASGCKANPPRRWNLIKGVWEPQPNNAKPLGNLTQFSFRQAPQLPVLPEDWKTYDYDTINSTTYVEPYCHQYVESRYVAPLDVRQEMRDLTLRKKKFVCMNIAENNSGCPTRYRQNSPRVHPTLVPNYMTKEYIPGDRKLFPYKTKYLNPKPILSPGYPGCCAYMARSIEIPVYPHPYVPNTKLTIKKTGLMCD